MTDTTPLGVPDRPPAPSPDVPPGLRERDYARGIVTVIGVLVLIVVAIWLTVHVLGIDLCGCTRGPASSLP